ncbi:MAG TPA: C40 family peptidase, partial [Acidimicrobiales bacterium]
AFMSVGVPGVDMVVSRSLSQELHLAPNSGVVLNAPRADPVALQNAVRRLIPAADVQLMRPGLDGIVIGGAGGSYLTAAQTTSMLTAALAEVGRPYVWGGVGPDGFDCSGLVGWAFNAARVSMPRTAAQQALAGPQVPLNKVQPGDLLFWSYDPQDPTFIDHVAIYLGNLLMVVAPQTGEQVKVARVNTDHLVGAVRVDPATAARVGGPRWP